MIYEFKVQSSKTETGGGYEKTNRSEKGEGDH